MRGRDLISISLKGLFTAALASMPAIPVSALELEGPPSLGHAVIDGLLPPIEERLPENPLVVDFQGRNLEIGKHGGTIRMLMARAKDTRQITVYGYARLVAYVPGTFDLEADILESYEVERNRVFTFKLRKGHRWSDGEPLTSEDFRYWWEDVANNDELSPSGPPTRMTVDGELPTFEVLDEQTFRYSWARPNPDFLPSLAGASPLYLYRPAHYMKEFHADYADPEALKALVEGSKRRNWAELHNRKDNLYRNDNVDLPTLQPWVVHTEAPAERFVFQRNPYYHRVDPEGKQLPYADEIVVQIANGNLIPAKTGTGESDLQGRYLSFDDYTFLKQSEDRFPFNVRLWRIAKGSHVALFPNMSHQDPVWRDLFRDVRFRRALSLSVNRHEINQVIYFGLALEGNNTVLPNSPLFREEYQTRWAAFDLDVANALLDEIGLVERDSRGVRLLPDGRPLEIIVETAGESTEQTDVLALVHDGWMSVGVKLYTKPTERTVFRNRIFAGSTQMSIWTGVENGLATALNSPADFVPSKQNQYQWPKWGQYLETHGKAGEPVDMDGPQQLLDLYKSWRESSTLVEKTYLWHQILEISADQVYSIGLISGVFQPVVVARNLKNVPEDGIYNWDPGAHFGIYRPDSFFFAPDGDTTAQRN